jgi:hypothetical protein
VAERPPFWNSILYCIYCKNVDKLESRLLTVEVGAEGTGGRDAAILEFNTLFYIL